MISYNIERNSFCAVFPVSGEMVCKEFSCDVGVELALKRALKCLKKSMPVKKRRKRVGKVGEPSIVNRFGNKAVCVPWWDKKGVRHSISHVIKPGEEEIAVEQAYRRAHIMAGCTYEGMPA